MKSPFFIASFLLVTFHTNAQNVGIGTATPAKPLDIAYPGGIQISRTENASSNNELFFSDNGQIRSLDNNHRIVFNRSSDQLELYEIGRITFNTGNPIREVMRINDNGYVGIGTSNPQSDLHIDNPFSNTAIKLTNSTTGNTGNSGTDIGQYGNNFALFNWQNGSIFFGTNGLLRGAIDGAGNFGIGTGNPTAKLDVEGNVKIVDGTQGDGKVLTSDVNGNANWKEPPAKQIYFEALLKNNPFTFNAGFGTALIMDTLVRNDGNAFDMNTSIFTAPSTGLYYFHLQVEWASNFNDAYLILRVNGDIYNEKSRWSRLSSVSFADVQSVTAAMYLSIGETLQFYVAESNSGTVTVRNWRWTTFLHGYKIY